MKNERKDTWQSILQAVAHEARCQCIVVIITIIISIVVEDSTNDPPREQWLTRLDIGALLSLLAFEGLVHQTGKKLKLDQTQLKRTRPLVSVHQNLRGNQLQLHTPKKLYEPTKTGCNRF